MRLSSLQPLVLLLLAAVLAVRALDDIPAPMQQLPPDPTEDASKPKLMRPQKGMHKQDHEVDSGNQRARADKGIEENAEPNQRVINSMDDLSADDLLAMLHAMNRGGHHDEL